MTLLKILYVYLPFNHDFDILYGFYQVLKEILYIDL